MESSSEEVKNEKDRELPFLEEISLFVEDSLIPHEYLEISRSNFRTAEQKLALAILEDAFYLLEKVGPKVLLADNPRRKHKVLYQETFEWFFDVEQEGVFTFQNVCDYLKFNPEYIRKGIANRIEFMKGCRL